MICDMIKTIYLLPEQHACIQEAGVSIQEPPTHLPEHNGSDDVPTTGSLPYRPKQNVITSSSITEANAQVGGARILMDII